MKTKLAKLATVNVVEIRNGTLTSVRAFRDIEKGNRQAEAVFAALVRANSAGRTWTDEDISTMLDDGTYEDGAGFELALIHSDMASESVEVPRHRIPTITALTR